MQQHDLKISISVIQNGRITGDKRCYPLVGFYIWLVSYALLSDAMRSQIDTHTHSHIDDMLHVWIMGISEYASLYTNQNPHTLRLILFFGSITFAKYKSRIFTALLTQILQRWYGNIETLCLFRAKLAMVGVCTRTRSSGIVRVCGRRKEALRRQNGLLNNNIGLVG